MTVYNIDTKEIDGKKYVVGFSFAKNENEDYELKEFEVRDIPVKDLWTADMTPCWYIDDLKGWHYMPVVNREKALRQKEFSMLSELQSTDWYAIRFAENGTPIPDEVLERRAELREGISGVREEIRELLSVDDTSSAEVASDNEAAENEVAGG